MNPSVETNGGDGERPLDVLLVDDDPDLREVLAKGLRRLGFNVVPVGTADEAIDAVAHPERVAVDVIVMDMVLPDSWGSQVVMQQREYRPDAKVVYISGYGEGDAVFSASVASPETPFLAKPFSVEELAELIRSVASSTE